jgi:hypothetical protein
MEQVSIKDAKPGMVLAKPIIDKQGRTIVNAGATLSQLYISRLGKWGVADLFIEDAATGEKSVAAPVNDSPRVSDQQKADQPQPATGASRPPGVYRGADLEEVIDRCFSGVIDDPLMVALRAAIRRNLLAGEK